MNKRRKNNNSKIISLIVVIICIIFGLSEEQINKTFGLITNTIPNQETATQDNSSQTKQTTSQQGELQVYFLDVGQADSILIKSNNEYMLIDGGNNNDGPLLVKYFQSLGIKEFKYIVGTHPHEDHIGGLDDVIKNFTIDNIYIPDAMTTTKTFEDLLDSIDEKNLTYKVPKINSTFPLGNANLKVIYTGTDTSDLNNTSIVLKLTYQDISILLTGDATSETEKKILNKDINSTVLKVGHHGSKYSSTESFLKKVNPKYAIISVGKNNIYNHPATTTINKLEKLNTKIYRTDQDGTILLETNGHNIDIEKLKTNTNGG